MKKINIKLEKIDIPEIKEADIMETIYHSKQILNLNKPIKIETTRNIIIKRVVLNYGYKSILIQAGLVLFLLMFGWLLLPSATQYLAMALLWTGGIIMAISIGAELIRSDIYQMSELENSCQFSPQRLLIWKMSILSGISIIGISLVSLIIAQKSDIQFLTLLTGGCFPFFCLTGMTLQLRTHDYLLTNFILLYVIALCGAIVLEMNYTNQILAFFDSFGILVLIASITYFIGVIKLHKNGGFHHEKPI